MTTITLNLNDDSFNSYAEFKGYTSDQGTKQDFVTQRLFDIIQNDLIEKRNRDAIAVVQAQPDPIVSPDQIVEETTQGVDDERPADGSI